MHNRYKGTVIWYDEENGFGIIRIRSSRKTVSIDNTQIHHTTSETIRALHVGQPVSFQIINTEARNLYLL